MVKNKLKGFTLIEVLVVVAIVGVLAAVMLPARSDYKKRKAEIETPLDAESFNELPAEYIDNDRRAHETVTIQRHSDGSVWACIADAKCYEVK